MEYESFTRQATLVTAQGKVSHTVEHRKDPLTGRISTICPDLKDKWSSFVGETDMELIRELAENSASWCPFCKSIEEITPEAEYVQEGRWYLNGVWVFPNLFPRTAFEAVVTSSENHFLWLDQFSEEFVFNHVKAGITCIMDVHAADPALTHAVIGWNYLPPAGASLTHPHMQVSMRDIAFNNPAFLQEKSREYYEKTGSNYWNDCMREERHIATRGRTVWMTPYAPTGFNEIRAVVKDVSNFTELEDTDIRDLAAGISNSLRFYADRGCSAFNMLIYSGDLSQHSDWFWLGVTLITRSNMRSLYLNIDSWYMPKLLGEEIVAESPEELAQAVKEYFGGC
ncbi:MAG: hypothetical protein HXS52_04495 [Theionarchaea archaeon]|nr:hypothetical protein [Theionarchaea archaeon]MBU7037166.1 hypothetical protein [Theionarchaea archaeon]